MLIQVAYPGGKHDYVNGSLLDKLIDEKQVVKFRRRTGWVTVGVDPIRSNKNIVNFYPERRAALQAVDPRPAGQYPVRASTLPM